MGDFLAETVVGGRDGEGGDISVAGGFVDGHVENTKVQLAQVEEGVVDVLGADEVVDDVVGDALGWGRGGGFAAAAGLVSFLPAGEVFGREGGVVTAQGAQLRGRPAPVLEHLAGGFDKVPYGVGAVETGVDRLGDEVVDTVAQLVEEGDDFVVLEETGLLGGGLGEVAHQRGGGITAVASCVDEAL